MRVDSASFTASTDSPDYFPQHSMPEVAFAGRSNVGKSSLINCIVNRRGLARASSTPGRTRSINFYNVNDEITLVDLPGYGYSKAPKSVQARLVPLVETYLLSGRPVLVVSIVDCRRRPEASDLELWQWLSQHDTPFVVVATKVDKISRSKQGQAVRQIAESFEKLETSEVITFSSQTGVGKKQLWARIEAAIAD